MSSLPTEKVDIDYLKQDHIGKVLAKGLAVLYQEKPSFPIDYFAKWLLNYSAAVENEGKLEGKQKEKEDLRTRHKEELEQLEALMQLESENRAKDAKIDEDFRTLIINHDYHNEILINEFPNFLEQRKKLTGVYVGALDYPTRPIGEEEDDENAHLVTDAARLIN